MKSPEGSLPLTVTFEILSVVIFLISKKEAECFKKEDGIGVKREKKIDQYLIFSPGDMFRH